MHYVHVVVCRSLRAAWENLKERTDRVGVEHTEAAKSMLEAADRVHAFTDTQKDTKKQVTIDA